MPPPLPLLCTTSVSYSVLSPIFFSQVIAPLSQTGKLIHRNESPLRLVCNFAFLHVNIGVIVVVVSVLMVAVIVVLSFVVVVCAAVVLIVIVGVIMMLAVLLVL